MLCSRETAQDRALIGEAKPLLPGANTTSYGMIPVSGDQESKRTPAQQRRSRDHPADTFHSSTFFFLVLYEASEVEEAISCWPRAGVEPAGLRGMNEMMWVRWAIAR